MTLDELVGFQNPCIEASAYCPATARGRRRVSERDGVEYVGRGMHTAFVV
jgi:hypothetical protein